ncbi:hypothetical protein WN48_06496 [Eufriesea mexicana]|uniref:Uncharacterized protein n=1 Tax=Eufriesea mexicana TaxID=516756 RepID=A0A310SED2_9HYME|nr:hypothetical protein WN48_06496 [Eufriesea mexicana]
MSDQFDRVNVSLKSCEDLRTRELSLLRQISECLDEDFIQSDVLLSHGDSGFNCSLSKLYHRFGRIIGVLSREKRDVEDAWIKTDRIGVLACSQLGLYLTMTETKARTIPIEFRIQSVKIWNLSDQGVIRLLPMDFLEGDTNRELDNVGALAPKNGWAACDYTWPVAHREHVFSSQPGSMLLPVTGDNITYISTGPNQDVEIHYHIMWRVISKYLKDECLEGYETCEDEKDSSDNVNRIDEEISGSFS